jgi:hypothetical protein
MLTCHGYKKRIVTALGWFGIAMLVVSKEKFTVAKDICED